VGKKNKKAKGDKLPKTIAGVKVPKDLRGAGGLLARLAREPAAREVALAALTAALAVRKDNRKAARKIVSGDGDGSRKSGGASSWVAPALTAAAVEAGRMLVDAFDDRKRKPAAAPDERGSDDGAPPSEKAPSGVTH
jgi:hypothetical protein